jgi:acyl dehydratase
VTDANKFSALDEDDTVYFDDLTVGQTFVTAGRTVTEADVAAFAGLSGDYNPLHTDKHYAASQTSFGERIAHGLLVLAIASGLTTRLPISQAMQENVLGLLNLETKWPTPTRFGDTLRVRVTIEDLRETTRPSRGVVTMRRDAINQDDELVMTSEWKLLVRRRERPVVE